MHTALLSLGLVFLLATTPKGGPIHTLIREESPSLRESPSYCHKGTQGVVDWGQFPITVGDALLDSYEECTGLLLRSVSGEDMMIIELELGISPTGALCCSYSKCISSDGAICVEDQRSKCVATYPRLSDVRNVLVVQQGAESIVADSVFFGINGTGHLAVFGATGLKLTGTYFEALPDPALPWTQHCGGQVPVVTCIPDPGSPCGGQTSQCYASGNLCMCLVGSGHCLKEWTIRCPADHDCVPPQICEPYGSGSGLICSCQ